MDDAIERYVSENCGSVVADVLKWRRAADPDFLEAFDKWATDWLFENMFSGNPPIVAAHLALRTMRVVRAAHEAESASKQ